MFWCHNCRLTIYQRQQCSTCPRCTSSAIEQESVHDSPTQFQPYVIRPSILSLLPPPHPPALDLTQFGGPVRIRVETTLLRSVEDPARIRVIRQYFVVPDINQDEKTPVDKQKLSKLERIEELSQCAVCQDEDCDDGIMLPCKHAFHEKCIMPWFSQTNTCPCCRTIL